jgi:hypothetical protein
MLRDVNTAGRTAVNVDALRSEIRRALIDQKANACPIAMRLAWHASGTYCAATATGGSNGATIRFAPEQSDPANEGLHIVRDLLLRVKQAHPDVSLADLYAVAGCMAVEFLGGPRIPFNFGRTDDVDNRRCPANGRLPDASQGLAHLRAVFGRMGFNDREIVALSGGHTLGRMHKVRSGFDGPWTTAPLKFDNEYYRNLVHLTWVKRDWTGPLQYEDKESGKLAMLPTDIALLSEPATRAVVEEYARSEEAFFRDFAAAFGKLVALGCPPTCQPTYAPAPPSPRSQASAEFREQAMHGSTEHARKLAPSADVHQREATSGRTALHKAAFWGHVEMVTYLLKECHLDPNVQDNYGDTAVHDAAKFGHVAVVRLFVEAKANLALKNHNHQTALELAETHGKAAVVALLREATPKL